MALTADKTFYPTAKMAMDAPKEELAYVATLNVKGKPDSLCTVDVNPESSSYLNTVSELVLPNIGDELHHFGWNACSAHLCPYAPHPDVERRYLLVPGLRSSRMYIIDTKDNPKEPKIIKTIEPEELMEKTGYSRPHTIHCGPEGIYVSVLGGGTKSGEGPGGIFLIDHETLEIKGQWENDRGSQFYAYDFWWHLGHDRVVTSEWATPDLFENGLNLEAAVGGRYGHKIHIWDLKSHNHLQELDLGKENQMVLELRPSKNPKNTYGFVGVVVNTQDLSASIWTWYLEKDQWKIKKTITIPAQPAAAEDLPAPLKQFGAAPPLITDINLSLDDKFLYVSCWGTGELHQYDVSDPFSPKLVGMVEIGGVAKKKAHPSGAPATGGPQMVEVSRDGKRVYFTNSLYSSWDDQFYDDIKGWFVKADVNPNGGIELDKNFFMDFGDQRTHQVRLQGGDSSSDSFCFPNED